MDFPRITKTQVKFIQSLKQKKFRQMYNKYTIESHKVIKELLEYNDKIIDLVVGTEEYLEEHSGVFNLFHGEVIISSAKNIEMMSQLKNAGNVLAMCSVSDELVLKGEISTGKYLYLESIQDPGNIGTLFRTADWFGYNGVLLSENSVELYNQKVISSSMGSVFRVPYAYISDKELKDIAMPKIATTLQGQSLKEFKFPKDFILCLGNEGQGLNQETINQSDYQIFIEGNDRLGAESLNVAISGAIFMFHSK